MAAPKEKSNIMTAIVLDFETGGKQCRESAATQLSAHAVRLDTFEVIGKFNEYIYPYHKQLDAGKPKPKKLKSKYEEEPEPELMGYEKDALEYSDISMEDLYDNGKSIEDVCSSFIDFVKEVTFPVKQVCRPFLVGQNILFDIGFLQQIFTYTGKWGELCKLLRGSKDYWGNYQPYYQDTMVFSQLMMGHDLTINSWALGNLCDILGIELDDAHNADADVEATCDVLKEGVSRMRNGNSEGGFQLAETKKEKTRQHFKI